jgi:hypothetical protein
VAWDNPEHFPVQHVRLMSAPVPRRERLLYGEVEGGGDRSLSATALSADATPAPSADVGPDRLR